MSDLINDINYLTNKDFSGTPEDLKNLIMALEAKSIFDVDNWTDEQNYILSYLKDLNKIYNVDLPVKKVTKKVVGNIGLAVNKLSKKYGYNYSNEAYKKLRKYFKQKLYEDKVTEAWTGLSQGCDICFAHAVIELRELGFPIKLCCAIPFESFNTKLTGQALQIYNNIIRRADVVEILSTEEYTPELLQKRSEYIINKSNLVYFECNTKEDFPKCFEFAEEKKKSVKVIDVENLKEVTL